MDKFQSTYSLLENQLDSSSRSRCNISSRNPLLGNRSGPNIYSNNVPLYESNMDGNNIKGGIIQGPACKQELVDVCRDDSSQRSDIRDKSLAHSYSRMQHSVICSVCSKSLAQAGTNAICCASCHKWIHVDCDRDGSIGSLKCDYVCHICRSSPIVSDVMIPSGNSLLASPNSLSAHDEASRHAIFDTNTLYSNSSRNSPFNDFSNTDGAINELFNLGQTPARDDPLTTLASSINTVASSTSLRNSPAYLTEGLTSNEMDMLRLASRPRGRGPSKMGVGRSTVRTRSFGGMNDISEISSVGRGKRGTRGGKKSARGRRPRGGKTTSTLAMVSSVTNLIHREEQENVDVDEVKHRCYDNEYIRTIVVTSASNKFIQQASICLICGSIGKNIEGAMVSCVSCSQSYHTYCVGLHDKLNETIIKRGWRCLDCTVCEGCGDGQDESNLILCDECDISYHIYCLDPPLEQIPHGSWRCKWCSACRRCGTQVPNRKENHHMDGLCEECFSLRKCLKCYRLYDVGDHLIKCQSCWRWFHGKCEEIFGDEMLEAASENGFHCSLCRPQGKLSVNDNVNILMCDNVALTKSAWDVFQTRYGGIFSKSAPMINESVFDAQSTYGYNYRAQSLDEIYDDEELDALGPIGGGVSMIPSGRGRGMRGGGSGRRMLKIGVGGFFVKIPRHRISAAEDDNPVEDDSQHNQKPRLKRPRKPRRSQLEDSYPPVIQESFFGLKPVEGRVLLDVVIQEPALQETYKPNLEIDKHRQPFELSEAFVETLRDGEDVLQLMDTDIICNMETIDFDNLDIDIFTEVCVDEDDDALDIADGSSLVTQSPPNSLCTNQHGNSFYPPSNSSQVKLGQANEINAQSHVSQRAPGLHQNSAYRLPTSMASMSQSNSRSSSQMGENFVERVNQATERWEEDEPLGERATKAAVLYANVNHPEWKKEYPEWNERVKQIHRMWRSLDADSRQKYVNKARENRASRAKQPKVKRLAPGYLHTMVGSSQSSSPQTSSTNCFYSQDGELIRNVVPGVNSFPGGIPNQQASIAHLNKEVLDNYTVLQRRSNELYKYQMAIENDLARMRKQKKNLTAKRRQLNKNNQQLDAHGQRIEIELNDADKCSLATLINAIPIRQKDLENCKRDIKQHSSNIRDFEVKNHIPADYAPHIVQFPQSVPFGGTCAPQVASSMNSGGGGVRPPPPYSSVSDHRSSAQPFQVVNYAPNQSYAFPKAEIDHSHLSSGPPTPCLSRRESTSSVDWTKARISRKRKVDDEVEEYQRPTQLGGVFASSLATQLQIDVFDVVDHLLTQVAIMIDGAEAARKSGILKRLLEPVPTKIFCNQRSFSSIEPPQGGLNEAVGGNALCELVKPKKKRTQQKKPPIGNSSEYDLLLERISTQLRLCPPLPRRALEPVSRIDRSSFSSYGVTDLNDKLSVVGDAIGKTNLSFMSDFYTRIFERVIDSDSFALPMYPFYPDVKIFPLYQSRYMPPNLYWFKNSEFESPRIKMKALSVERRSRSPRIGNVSRIPETLIQQPPHRSAFQKNIKTEKVDDVKVKLIFECNKDSFDSRDGFLILMKYLDMYPIPNYEIDTPPRTPEISCELEKVKVEPIEEKLICHLCRSVMNEPAIRQSAEQLKINIERQNGEFMFCSMACYYNFIVNSRISLSTDDLQKAERFVDQATLIKLRQISAENFAKCLQLGKIRPDPISIPVDFGLSDGRVGVEQQEMRNAYFQIMHAKDLSVLNDVKTRKTDGKRWKGELWMQYNTELSESFKQLNILIRKKHMAAQLQYVGCPLIRTEDSRTCAFCSLAGDDDPDACGRLINADADVWIHVNCALWSQEVYEGSRGGLFGVEEALSRATVTSCFVCKETGASIRCSKGNCDLAFHLHCARSVQGRFMKDKLFTCGVHDDTRADSIDGLQALRRIYVDREENQLISKLFLLNNNKPLVLRVGSLIFNQLGQLLPDQLKRFHNSEFIFPIGYSVTRIFWSPFDVNEKIHYKCSIVDNKTGPLFKITYERGDEICESTASDAWSQIINKVKENRQKIGNRLNIFNPHISGEMLFGLRESAISKMTESLPGVDQLVTYTFKHGGSPLMDLPLAVNPRGCARGEPRFRTLIKHKHCRNQPSASATVRPNRGLDIVSREARTRSMPIVDLASNDPWNSYTRWETGQFGTYYSQYQKMKKDWKNNVYLARSQIQGLGLYASRNIDMSAMIIEYKGELIRSEVGEMREKRYEAQNRGVYMFRIDEERLIDATMAGGPARYINHSCDPNCNTRLVDSGLNGEEKKIIITANRPIAAGEELTYDYQFDIEDTDDKIACLCGAPNCQKWMN